MFEITAGLRLSLYSRTCSTKNLSLLAKMAVIVSSALAIH